MGRWRCKELGLTMPWLLERGHGLFTTAARQSVSTSQLLLCKEKLVDEAPDLARVGDVLESRVVAPKE